MLCPLPPLPVEGRWVPPLTPSHPGAASGEPPVEQDWHLPDWMGHRLGLDSSLASRCKGELLGPSWLHLSELEVDSPLITKALISHEPNQTPWKTAGKRVSQQMASQQSSAQRELTSRGVEHQKLGPRAGGVASGDQLEEAPPYHGSCGQAPAEGAPWGGTRLPNATPGGNTAASSPCLSSLRAL